jgi:hypothetical protein
VFTVWRFESAADECDYAVGDGGDTWIMGCDDECHTGVSPDPLQELEYSVCRCCVQVARRLIGDE